MASHLSALTQMTRRTLTRIALTLATKTVVETISMQLRAAMTLAVKRAEALTTSRRTQMTTKTKIVKITMTIV